MQYLAIIQALLPILERIIAALEASGQAGSTMTVPPQTAQLRKMVADMQHMVDSSQPAHDGEDRLTALEMAVADLHAALSDKPSPAAVQQAVADVKVPAP
jgi:hypothetical protein